MAEKDKISDSNDGSIDMEKIHFDLSGTELPESMEVLPLTDEEWEELPEFSDPAYISIEVGEEIELIDPHYVEVVSHLVEPGNIDHIDDIDVPDDHSSYLENENDDIDTDHDINDEWDA